MMKSRPQYELESPGRPLDQLRPEDRAFLVVKLAEILVPHYQANQGFTPSTGKPGGAFNRGKEAQKPGVKRR